MAYLKHCALVRRIFGDYFSRNESLAAHWQLVSSAQVFTLKGQLRFTFPGEVAYDGDPLVADSAIIVQFSNAPDMVFEIRGRRSDTENFVCFRLDFEAQEISLDKVEGGSRATLVAQSHNLSQSPLAYNAGLYMSGDTVMGFVNGSYIIGATTDFNQSVAGFSLFVPAVYEGIYTAFDSVQVFTIESYPENPTIPNDPSDIAQQYRIMLKEWVENPAARTYENFLHARQRWEAMQDFGRTNREWSLLGYPIYPPLTEEWFKKA